MDRQNAHKQAVLSKMKQMREEMAKGNEERRLLPNAIEKLIDKLY